MHCWPQSQSIWRIPITSEDDLNGHFTPDSHTTIKHNDIVSCLPLQWIGFNSLAGIVIAELDHQVKRIGFITIHDITKSLVAGPEQEFILV